MNIKQTLTEAHEEFMKVPVSGPAIEPMYIGLAKLAQVINSMPDEEEPNDKTPENS